jgi:hypothetical protein
LLQHLQVSNPEAAFRQRQHLAGSDPPPDAA